MLTFLQNVYSLLFVRESKPCERLTAEQVKNFTKEEDVFYYDADGFGINEEERKLYCKWADIETVFGYKVDLITTDDIRLGIYLIDDTTITLSESMPGWFQFNLRLVESIPDISIGWQIAIMLPAFATNLTLLFDRKGRSDGELESVIKNST